MNHQRDGQLRHKITAGSINYWPNRKEAVAPAKVSEGGYLEYPQKVVGIKQRIKTKKFREHFNQAQLFYNSMSPPEKAHIVGALSFELDRCDDPIVYERMVERLTDIDLELAQSVAVAVGAPTPSKAGRPNHGNISKPLSQTFVQPQKPTIASRRVAIIIADGYDAVAYNGVKAALIAAQAIPFTFGPKRQPIFAAGEEKSGKGIQPDHNLEGMRSTMFDSIFIPGGSHIETLKKNGRALHWVREAFGHLKAIGATGEGVQLVKLACDLQGMHFSAVGSQDVVDSYGVVTAGVAKPESFKEMLNMAKGAKDFINAYTFNIASHRNFDREMDGLNAMVAY